MYSKFNCKVTDALYNGEKEKYCKRGIAMYEQYAKQSRDTLKKFILENGRIDATALKKAWFKTLDVDVFISHSHHDIDEVKAFAGWLNATFDLKVFIDTCAWGYCNDLLLDIDKRYCKCSDGQHYNYDKRNYSTSHVHAMLSTALVEMIDKTECLIFYNTPNSICLQDELKKVKGATTLSPWIYQ